VLSLMIAEHSEDELRNPRLWGWSLDLLPGPGPFNAVVDDIGSGCGPAEVELLPTVVGRVLQISGPGIWRAGTDRDLVKAIEQKAWYSVG
jgi:hypothetical protein